MAKKRPKIPKDCEYKLRYLCASVCCVCQSRAVRQIHHIDSNPENNSIENLVFLCHECHDEAHATRKLSKNLTPDSLAFAKHHWEDSVAKNASLAMLPQENSLFPQDWCYFNMNRIPSLMNRLGLNYDQRYFTLLRENKEIDEKGIPDWNPSKGHLKSIFDFMSYRGGHLCCEMYSKTVADIILASNPIEFLASTNKSVLQAVMKPGDLFFINKSFYFKKDKEHEGWRSIYSYSKFRSIRIEFIMETRLMFSSSALSNTFRGCSNIFGLFLVKSINEESGILVFKVSPIAIGTGMSDNNRTNSPYFDAIDKNTSKVTAAYFAAMKRAKKKREKT